MLHTCKHLFQFYITIGKKLWILYKKLNFSLKTTKVKINDIITYYVNVTRALGDKMQNDRSRVLTIVPGTS